MLPIIAIVLILVGLIALWFGRRYQVEAGLPPGRVVYADTGRWRALKKPLFSSAYRLVGKPDYLVQRGQQMIPVEVKSSNAPSDGPHRSHLLQLAAYCLLVQENYSRRPKYGIVKYADRMFEVDFSASLESTLLNVLDAMRDDLAAGRSSRSHTEPGRCVRCAVRAACNERLV